MRACVVSRVSTVVCNPTVRRHGLDRFVVALCSDVALVIFLESR